MSTSMSSDDVLKWLDKDGAPDPTQDAVGGEALRQAASRYLERADAVQSLVDRYAAKMTTGTYSMKSGEAEAFLQDFALDLLQLLLADKLLKT